jgi:hypothetical protein
MKKALLAIFATSIAMYSYAQTDSTQKERVDTIKIGGMVIIKKNDGKNSTVDPEIIISKGNHSKKNANVSTNWGILDIGFANFDDKTNYAKAQADGFLAPGVGEDQFQLRTGKSVNVNLWIFMQRYNLVKHVLNLKYGFGVELNNYQFDDKRVFFEENPTKVVIDERWKDANKNKLAADYITVPLMLNINFTPGRERGFGLSGGISAGYLYSARQKIKINGERLKNHDDFNLQPWKLSYIGEINLGPVKLYGSYAFESMWDKSLDQTPYNFGLRFSRF